MAALRELVLKLSANTVEFRRDLDGAVRSVNDLSTQITRSLHSANSALMGFAAAAASALSLEAMVEMVRHTTESLSELDQMAQKTGASVENLARLSKVAQAFGGDAAAINLALNNLARGMAGTDEESSKTNQALQALGISTHGLAQQDPSAVFIAVAQSLQQYRDGAAKAAIMTDLFKKGAVDLLPYMNNVAHGLDEFEGVTRAAAEEATRFHNQLGIVHVRLEELSESMVSAMLPSVNDFLEALNQVSKESSSLVDEAALTFWAEQGVQAFAFLLNAAEGFMRMLSVLSHQIAASAALMTAGSSAARKAIVQSYEEDMASLLEAPLKGQQALERMAALRQARQDRQLTQGAGGAANLANAANDGKDARPVLNYGGMDDKNKVAELIKRQGEAAIKVLDALIAQEKQVLDSRNRFLDYYNNENLMSFSAYYAARHAAQQAELSETLKLYDQEIAALTQTRNAATTHAARTEAQGRINELQQKKAERQRQSAEDAIFDTLKETKAYEDLERQLHAVNAELLDLQGRAGDAARLRLPDQDLMLRRRLSAENNQGGLNSLDQLEQAKIAQADYNQLSAQSSLIQERLRTDEERAAIAQYSGAMSELEMMHKVSDARQQAVKDLQDIVVQQELVAQASANPALINQANAARTALEKLRAESNLLEQKFHSLFVDSLSSPLTDFVLGTKSASQAFKAFADTVVSQITRMAAQAVSEQLYQKLLGMGQAGQNAEGGNGGAGGNGSNGGGNGGGGWLGGFSQMVSNLGSQLWGGNGAGNRAGSAANPLPVFNPNSIDMTAPYGAAGPSMSIADLANFPGLAMGGPVSAHQAYYVGEFGKEVFVPEANGRILPRSGIEGNTSNIIHIQQNIPKDMSRQSASQLAADTGLQVNRALRRLG